MKVSEGALDQKGMGQKESNRVELPRNTKPINSGIIGKLEIERGGTTDRLVKKPNMRKIGGSEGKNQGIEK